MTDTQPDAESTETNSPGRNELTITVAGAIEVQAHLTVIGAPGTQLGGEFTLSQPRPTTSGQPTITLTGNYTVEVQPADIIEAVDQALGDEAEGAAQVKSYVQKEGE